MLKKYLNRLRGAHVPHSHLYAVMALLAFGGCLGLDKTIYGLGITAAYCLLARDARAAAHSPGSPPERPLRGRRRRRVRTPDSAPKPGDPRRRIRARKPRAT